LVTYVEAMAMSVLFWGALSAAAARRTGGGRWVARGLLLALAMLAVGGELYTFDRYQAYLNSQAVLVGTSMLPSVGQQLWSDRVTFAHAMLPAAIAALLWPWLARRIAPTRRRAARWAPDVALVVALLMAFSAPGRSEAQAATPDVLYVAAMGQLGRAHWDHNEAIERVHPGARSPLPVPALHATPARARNVLLL